MKLKFLGTGALTGVPACFCDCTGCEEARQNPLFHRTRCSLALLDGKAIYLLDASPDLRIQFLRENLGAPDALLLTHHHFDHSGGIGELESYVRLHRRQPLPAFLTTESRNWFESAFGYMSDCLTIRSVGPGVKFRLGTSMVTAVEAQHDAGTIGFLMETAGRRICYLPDTGSLPDSTCALLEGIETLILGATFWQENPLPQTHLSVQEAVDIGLDLRVGELYLTHLAMHYQPVTNMELTRYLGSRGSNLHLAYDGLSIQIR